MLKKIFFSAMLMLTAAVNAFAKYHVYAFFAGAVPNTADCYQVLVVMTYDDPDRGEVIKYFGVHHLGQGCPPCAQTKAECPLDPTYNLETDPASPACFSTLMDEDSMIYDEMHSACEAVVNPGRALGIIKPSDDNEMYFAMAPNVLSIGQTTLNVLFPKPSGLSNLHIEIVSSNGQLVKSQDVDGVNPAPIALPGDMPRGLYLVQLKQFNRTVEVERLIIK